MAVVTENPVSLSLVAERDQGIGSRFQFVSLGSPKVIVDEAVI